MTRVLVVDDEAQIRRALATNLRARGYDVDQAATGEEALASAADHHPDAVILDIGLPGLDGIDVVRGLRGWSTVPIIMLTVREDDTDKIEALDAGADDYVTKPFSMGELLARLRAALRRGTPNDEEAVVTTDSFSIDLAAKRVEHDGKDVHLTPIEWGIVEVLVRHPGKLVSQRQLLQDVSTNARRTTYGCTSRRSGASSSRTPPAPATSSPNPGWATASRDDRWSAPAYAPPHRERSLRRSPSPAESSGVRPCDPRPPN
jgi:two-component system KDP operon response regulator KdpE